MEKGMKKRILVEVGIKASGHILGAKLGKLCLRERESPTATPCPAKRDLTHKATPASCCCLNTEGKGPGSAQGQQLPSCETMGILTPRAGRGGSTALPRRWASRHPKHDVAGKPCPAWRWQGAGSCSSSPHPSSSANLPSPTPPAQPGWCNLLLHHPPDLLLPCPTSGWGREGQKHSGWL